MCFQSNKFASHIMLRDLVRAKKRLLILDSPSMYIQKTSN
jgi:hypothetical protein